MKRLRPTPVGTTQNALRKFVFPVIRPGIIYIIPSFYHVSGVRYGHSTKPNDVATQMGWGDQAGIWTFLVLIDRRPHEFTVRQH
jgi:hypothetical protein